MLLRINALSLPMDKSRGIPRDLVTRLSASYCAWNTYTFLVKYQKEPPAHLASDNLSKTHPTLGEREKNSSLADEKRQFENGLRLLPPFLARLAQGLPP